MLSISGLMSLREIFHPNKFIQWRCERGIRVLILVKKWEPGEIIVKQDKRLSRRKNNRNVNK